MMKKSSLVGASAEKTISKSKSHMKYFSKFNYSKCTNSLSDFMVSRANKSLTKVKTSSYLSLVVFLIASQLLILSTDAFALPSPSLKENETDAEITYKSYHTNEVPQIITIPPESLANPKEKTVGGGDSSSPGKIKVNTEVPKWAINTLNVQHPRNQLPFELQTAHVLGFRVEKVSKGVDYENQGVSVILSSKTATIRLFGNKFTKNTIIRFVTEAGDYGTHCGDLSSTKTFSVYKFEILGHSALSDIVLPPLNGDGENMYYICVRENNIDMPWIHQGTEQWLQIKTYESWLPLWLLVIIIVVLLLLSGLFSGLNLGLMALDRTEMKIVANTGTPRERKYAKIIQPLRNKGNYLLCSLLLGNVMVNSTLTILLDEVSSGLIAVIVSTLSIVILGEIIPQAICSRHGLAVGAKTVYLTKFFMLLTFPISYPISVLLDKALGEEIGSVYNRDRLKELIKVTDGYNDLEKDEMNIISGALDFKQKTVKDIMTKLDSVFMFPIETILDFDTVSEILAQGYSRIPVYEGSRPRVISLLFTRDLALYDPADKMPLRRFCQFYNNNIMFVFDTTTLDVLFKDFKQGEQGHMAFVQTINTMNQESDPIYEIIGLVTLEDVIEELIQAEINDETDVYDLKHQRSRSSKTACLTYPWNTHDSNGGIEVSPQLCLAAYQYLSTSVDEFGTHRISKTILQRLLNQNFFFQIKIKRNNTDKFSDPYTTLYQRGKPCDYFVLILEGRVQSEMGKEHLIFECGPFTYFGVQALELNIVPETTAATSTLPKKEEFGTPIKTRRVSAGSYLIELYGPTTFLPDYTVCAVTDTTFLRIPRSIYMAAVEATMLERTHIENSSEQKEVAVNFEERIDKMKLSCHSLSTFTSSNNNSSSDSEDDSNNNYQADNISNRKGQMYTNGVRRRLSRHELMQNINTNSLDKRIPKKKDEEVLSEEVVLSPNLLLNGDSLLSSPGLDVKLKNNSPVGGRNLLSSRKTSTISTISSTSTIPADKDQNNANKMAAMVNGYHNNNNPSDLVNSSKNKKSKNSKKKNRNNSYGSLTQSIHEESTTTTSTENIAETPQEESKEEEEAAEDNGENCKL